MRSESRSQNTRLLTNPAILTSLVLNFYTASRNKGVRQRSPLARPMPQPNGVWLPQIGDLGRGVLEKPLWAYTGDRFGAA
ncbi:hypothetical protein [Brasilonema bromeliae]|uniref:Uncharacterized protein n=1 Tax=Brasilonema bromeliae SPC951 TaxID=385972 RepID=A0ABX1PCM2_9CYAN|nr:hypothetical protein [Brasilonema bromeliae]NMG21728.1 hypothetical protein [Brasilonema bromeliae SPC951]